MPEQTTAAESNLPYDEDKNTEENPDSTKIISIKTGRLLKLKHKLKALREEALHGYHEELEEFKSACNHTNALLGELNDGTGGNEVS
ncbi:MAG: hypothetical protein ACXADB_00080 [Candidatus Hermodarchaeia archaeon]|jgi:hypothetical protein